MPGPPRGNRTMWRLGGVLMSMKRLVVVVAAVCMMVGFAAGIVGYRHFLLQQPQPAETGPQARVEAEGTAPDAPKLLAVVPAAGSEVSLPQDGILEVRCKFDRPMSDEVSLSYSGGPCEVRHEGQPEVLLIRIVAPNCREGKYRFTAVFRDTHGRSTTLEWEGALVAAREPASTAEAEASKRQPPEETRKGSRGGEVPGQVAQPSEPPSGVSSGPEETTYTGPVPKIVAVRPAGGSRLTLPPDGVFHITVECDGPIPTSLSEGLGGGILDGDAISITSERTSPNTHVWKVKTYPGKEFWVNVIMRGQDGSTSTYQSSRPVLIEPELNLVAQRAQAIHRRVWEDLMARARTDRLAALALYAARSLAVKHPEVYLQADRLFQQTASSTRGFMEMYKYDPPTWEYDPDTVQREEKVWSRVIGEARHRGSCLDLASLDLNRYRVVARRDLVPAGAPYVPVLDHRVGALPVTLKRAGGRVTPIEMAFLRYFTKGRDPGRFVVFCHDESAYLWTASDGLVSAATGQPTQLTGRPLLIFNDESVWYPLMGRDDSKGNDHLRSAVQALVTDPQAHESLLAQLTTQERALIATSRAVTGLTPEDHPYALWAASKARYRAVGYAPYWEALRAIPYCEQAGDVVSASFAHFHIVGHMLQVDASLLSPAAAWIAGQEWDDPLAMARAVTGLYYQLARTGPWSTARTVWQPEMFWYDIEDSLLSRAGTCAVQAGIVSALLDLAGVENYLVWIWNPGGGHEYVYLPQFHKEVNNGYLTEVEGFMEALSFGAYSLGGLGRRGRFAVFSDEACVSSIPAQELVGVLTSWETAFRRVQKFGILQVRTYDQLLEELRSRGVRPATLR